MTKASPPACTRVPLAATADLTSEEQKNLICSILDDFAADPDMEVLFGYLRHCGLPITALRSVHDIIPAFLALYRMRPGVYNVERAFMDLRFWPPIATRIAELMAEDAMKRQQKLKKRPRRRN